MWVHAMIFNNNNNHQTPQGVVMTSWRIDLPAKLSPDLNWWWNHGGCYSTGFLELCKFGRVFAADPHCSTSHSPKPMQKWGWGWKASRRCRPQTYKQHLDLDPFSMNCELYLSWTLRYNHALCHVPTAIWHAWNNLNSCHSNNTETNSTAKPTNAEKIANSHSNSGEVHISAMDTSLPIQLYNRLCTVASKAYLIQGILQLWLKGFRHGDCKSNHWYITPSLRICSHTTSRQ